MGSDDRRHVGGGVAGVVGGSCTLNGGAVFLYQSVCLLYIL